MQYIEYRLMVLKVKNEEQFHKLEEELKRRDILRYALDSGSYSKERKEAEFLPSEACSWLRHAEDMVMISEKFPNMTFELECIGEVFGNYWKEYYHDGQTEYCRGEVVYEQPKKVQWTELMKF
jgi:hypothetical protein